jgi:hypothetical protein
MLDLRILLVRQIDEVAASVPIPNPAFELWQVLRVAAQYKRAKTIQGGEVIVAGLGTNGGPAISLYEMNAPQALVMLEVQQNAGHGRIVGWLRGLRECSSCGRRLERKELCLLQRHGRFVHLVRNDDFSFRLMARILRTSFPPVRDHWVIGTDRGARYAQSRCRYERCG